MNVTEERLAAVRSLLEQWGVDGIIVTYGDNYRWLSGFTGTNCTLVVTADQALLGTDFRYWEQAERQSPEFELVHMGRGEQFAQFVDLVKMVGGGRLVIEGSHVSIAKFRAWKKECADVEGVAFVARTTTVEGMRMVKTAAEIEMIREAAAITDAVMAQVNDLAKVGMTEKGLAWELEKRMREMGADDMAFDVIVAAGENGALAHHRPSDRPLQEGDSIVIDMGAKLNGYHSDLTRSFHMGENPDDKFWYVYNLVHMAQKNALENMKAGMTGIEIDALARDVIADAGHGDAFGHSLGHGVGLDIHEGPSLSFVSKPKVMAGSVVTVEPGVYLSGWGGVRIEDLVVVTKHGVEFLSHCPKTPIIKM